MLKNFRVDGGFPIQLFLDADRLPVSTQEISDLLRENNPVGFSGQRSPIYRLSNGLFLRAKGFAYRRNVYAEIKEHVLDAQKPMSMARAKELGLEMGKIMRPFPACFAEASAARRKICNPDGTFKTEECIPDPYGAMTLDRALNEYAFHNWARNTGLPVDLPVGYAEFPKFGFSYEGKAVPCGGFLALVPTQDDLRYPEVLFHLPHSSAVQSVYEFSVDGNQLLLHVLKSMGSILSRFHAGKVTHNYFHAMNVKPGLVDDNMKPKFVENGLPIVSVCDLDGAVSHINENVFLADMLGDIGHLLYVPLIFAYEPGSDLDCFPDDDQKWMHDLVYRMRDESGFKLPCNLLKFSALAGYFGTDPANEALMFVTLPQIQHDNIRDYKSLLVHLLKKRHGMSTEGAPDFIKRIAGGLF